MLGFGQGQHMTADEQGEPRDCLQVASGLQCRNAIAQGGGELRDMKRVAQF